MGRAPEHRARVARSIERGQHEALPGRLLRALSIGARGSLEIVVITERARPSTWL
jgi:hypothetical protein